METGKTKTEPRKGWSDRQTDVRQETDLQLQRKPRGAPELHSRPFTTTLPLSRLPPPVLPLYPGAAAECSKASAGCQGTVLGRLTVPTCSREGQRGPRGGVWDAGVSV